MISLVRFGSFMCYSLDLDGDKYAVTRRCRIRETGLDKPFLSGFMTRNIRPCLS